jgi:hypothetical protein
MDIAVSDVVLFAHPTCGVLATLAAVWVLVEALNASEANQARLRLVARAVAVLLCLAWGLGGYWYVRHYDADRAVILGGPWPLAHSVFMEVKEHLFFIPLILGLYLPIVAAVNLARNRAARAMVMVAAGLIVLDALAIEGAGAIVNHGVEAAYLAGAKAIAR